MDRSNFSIGRNYFDGKRRGEFGLLESETGDKIIAGFIALQPKCLKLEADSFKLTAKEVPRFIRKRSVMKSITIFIPERREVKISRLQAFVALEPNFYLSWRLGAAYSLWI